MADKNELLNNFKQKFEKMSTNEKSEYLETMGFAFDEPRINRGRPKVIRMGYTSKMPAATKFAAFAGGKSRCDTRSLYRAKKAMSTKRSHEQQGKTHLKFD